MTDSRKVEDRKEAAALIAAAEVMRRHGIDICTPYEGSLDDRERECFNALRKAIAAYNERATPSPSPVGVDDGWPDKIVNEYFAYGYEDQGEAEDCLRDALARHFPSRTAEVIAALAPITQQIQEIVRGWHSNPGYERHPLELGVTLKTTCGVCYAIAAALASSPQSPVPADEIIERSEQ